MQKLMINQAYDNMGLHGTQILATVFDGITRHSPEGRWFQELAAAEGFHAAVEWRDSGPPDPRGWPAVVSPRPLPVAPAGSWFERRDAGGGVTHITEPHVDPFLRCNCWHVPGRDADLLIDTGLGLVSLLAYARDLFEGRRVIAVATHYHFDHVGGLHEFDERVIHSSEADDHRGPGAHRRLAALRPRPRRRTDAGRGGGLRAARGRRAARRGALRLTQVCGRFRSHTERNRPQTLGVQINARCGPPRLAYSAR